MELFIYAATMIVHYIAKIFNIMCTIRFGVIEYVYNMEIL